MKKEMKMLREMVEEGKITHQDVWEIIHTIDEAERKTVWEEEEFDPRRMTARLKHSSSETMLDDIISLELNRVRREALGMLISSNDDERSRFVDKVADLKPMEFESLEDLSLTDKLRWLTKQDGPTVWSALAQLKGSDGFEECEELNRFDLAEQIEQVTERARLCHVEVEQSFDMDVRPEDTIRLRWPTQLEIVSSSNGKLGVTALKRGWGSSEAEARADAESLEIWSFLEGDRIWIRDSHLWGETNEFVLLKLFVPFGMKVVALVGGSARLEDVGGNFSIDTHGGEFTARSIQGHLRINAWNGPVHIDGMEGDVQIEAIAGGIEVSNCRGDVEMKSILGDMALSSLSGHCKVTSIEGSIRMSNICTPRLDLRTKTGKIYFDGIVMPGGSYSIQTKTGDIEVALDRRSDCGLTAETKEGKIEATFPFRGESWPSGPYGIHGNVRMGSGSMDISSESGNIVIREKT